MDSMSMRSSHLSAVTLGGEWTKALGVVISPLRGRFRGCCFSSSAGPWAGLLLCYLVGKELPAFYMFLALLCHSKVCF